MSFSARLSVAPTLNVSPLAICCVSAVAAVAPLPLVAVSVIVGLIRSGVKPPGLRWDSHAQPASARTHSPHRVALARLSRIETPGLLPGAGRHQVIDDVWRDQYQEITPVFLLVRKPEQLAEDRQVYKKGNSGLGYRDLGHREPADDGRFTVRHEDLVVRLLRLEREPDVHRRGHHVRALGVHLHQDLTVG